MTQVLLFEIAHLAFDLGARHQGRDRVDDDHVHRARAHQVVGDLERLLAGVGLGDVQVGDVHAQLLGVGRVEGVLGVDEHRVPPELLRVGDDGERERRLARGFGPVDLDHPAARHSAHAEREVEPDRAGGDHVDRDPGALLAQLHDRALAELLLDLLEREVEGLRPFLGRWGVADHDLRLLRRGCGGPVGVRGREPRRILTKRMSRRHRRVRHHPTHLGSEAEGRDFGRGAAAVDARVRRSA